MWSLRIKISVRRSSVKFSDSILIKKRVGRNSAATTSSYAKKRSRTLRVVNEAKRSFEAYNDIGKTAQ